MLAIVNSRSLSCEADGQGQIRYDQIQIPFYERLHHRTARRETQRDPGSYTWIAFG
jgi:hypothetical protein